MATIYKFKDKDGIVKWGEISVCYNPNKERYHPGHSKWKGLPVKIDEGYPNAGEIRYIKFNEIIESR